MIIVTDAKLRILSVNDAAIKTLQQAQAELLGRPLFDVLLLRDSTHKLVTQNTFEKQLAQGGEFTIMRSPIAKRTVTMQSQSIHNTEGTVAEISFIITYTNSNHDPLAVTLDKARARYETLMQSVKRQLAANKRSETQKELLLLEKIESDTYTLQTVHELQTKQTIEKIDIAKLCKQIVALNQEFATALTVKNNFELLNFGMKDIAPLTVKNYPVKPEQLTGPFFTVSCNAKTVEILIKKLLDITMFLATTAKHPKVTTSVSQTTDTVTVRVKGQSTLNQKEADESLWLPYYGALNHKTNLRLGSGLEGFLAKKIADTQKMKLSVNCDPKTESITFTLVLHKRPKPL